MREARIHVRQVRDLLKSLDPSDAHNGVDCASLSFLSAITQGDIMGKVLFDFGCGISERSDSARPASSAAEKKRNRTDAVDYAPPDYVVPGTKEPPVVPLQPFGKDARGPACLKVGRPSESFASRGLSRFIERIGPGFTRAHLTTSRASGCEVGRWMNPLGRINETVR